MQHFIGRKRELHVLEAEYAKPSSFVVIYGRRRVGKTTLIKEFIKDKQALYFLATQESESQSMKGFTASLATFTGQDFLETANFSNWEALFRIFVESKSNKKKVLIIDEFQYLVQTNPAFPSIFQKAWDELLANNDIMVILCGSFISMSYGSPLYGRRTAQIKLQPLRFTEIMVEYPEWSFSSLVELYSVAGGVPKYFEFFRNEMPLMDTIRTNILSKSGFLYEEPLFLLANEVREPISYLSLMRTISEGRHRLSEIATVLERPANSLSPYLETLIDLNLIDRRVPVTEKAPEKSRRGLYFIADNFINFWFRYVHPHRGELELDHDELVLQRLKDTFVESYVSLRYEDICKDIFLWLCQEKKIDFTPSRIGAYWNQKSTVEIDVVAVDIPNKRIFAAECKYLRDNPISIGVYSNLLKKCKNRDFDGYQITYGLFSRTGFDDRLVDLARNNENLLLINENQVLSSLP